MAALAVLCAGVAASALTPGLPVIEDAVTIDGQNSVLSARLVDDRTGLTESESWSNATNEWRDDYYPMTAVNASPIVAF